VIYFVSDFNQEFVKIGRTSNIKKRQLTLQTANPLPLLLVAQLTKHANDIEREAELHRLFNHHNISGEWYDYKPIKQWLGEHLTAKEATLKLPNTIQGSPCPVCNGSDIASVEFDGCWNCNNKLGYLTFVETKDLK
jgi:hypothetical protein